MGEEGEEGETWYQGDEGENGETCGENVPSASMVLTLWKTREHVQSVACDEGEKGVGWFQICKSWNLKTSWMASTE